MLSYRSQPSFEMRFARRPHAEDLFAIESYLRYQGQQLVDRFDPATYVTLTRAMDTHDVSRGRGDFDDVLRVDEAADPRRVDRLGRPLLAVGAARGRAARPRTRGSRVMDSPHGHDAFLIDVDRLSDMVVDFRGRPRRRREARRRSSGCTPSAGSRCSSSGRGRSGRSSSSRSARSAPSSSATSTSSCAWWGWPTGAARFSRRTGIDSTPGARRSRRPRRPGPSRRERAGAPRSPRAPAAAGPRGPHRGRRDGGGLRAGVPPRDRRGRVEQAAARDLPARARGAPPVATPAPPPLPLRHRRRREPARHRRPSAGSCARRSHAPGGGLALGDARATSAASSAAGSRSRSRRAGRWGSATARRTRATTSPGATPPARRSSSRARWARTSRSRTSR